MVAARSASRAWRAAASWSSTSPTSSTMPGSGAARRGARSSDSASAVLRLCTVEARVVQVVAADSGSKVVLGGASATGAVTITWPGSTRYTGTPAASSASRPRAASRGVSGTRGTHTPSSAAASA